MWCRRGEAASARPSAALYSVYGGLYSEAVVSSVASAVALVEVGRFREAVQYVQRAAKALYEAAKEAFEKVKVTVQRLVELFVEAVARVLAWVDEHKAYLFLMAAAAAGVVALSVALNMWGLVELDKLAYAASLTPFIPAGVEKYSREEAFNILKNDPDPYEKFKKIAKAANVGRVKLAETWESLRKLILPRSSEEGRLMKGKAYSELNEEKKRALFYASFALEEALGVYRSALGEYAKGLREAVRREEVGEEPFKKVVYTADLGQIKQLAKKEEEAFENALSTLREKLNEYSVEHGLGGLLDVNEDVARRLAEAKQLELSRFSGVSFSVKAYVALVAYREYALGRRSPYGVAAWHWLEVGGSAWLLYYAPITAYNKAKKAKVVRPAAVEELVAEALRRLFLKPGADHLHGFVEELEKGGRLALELEEKKTKEKTGSYVFKLYRVEEGGGLKELDIRLRIRKLGESIVYALEFDDIERWQGFFKQELEAAMKAAEEVRERLPVEDRFPYMVGWVDSDVAIIRRRNERVLQMSTSHLWQLAETHALFDWSNIVVRGVSLTLEGPKPEFYARTSLDKLDKAIRRSAEGGWLKMLGTKAGLKDLMYVKSWDDLKRWVVENWDIVVNAAVRRLGEGVRGELEALRDRLNDDKIARGVIAPALLLIQAERLGVNEETLRYFGAVVSGAIDGDGTVYAAMRMVGLTSGKYAVALLWGAALAAYGIKTKVEKSREVFLVAAFGGDAVRLARLYFLYGAPLLEGDERIINHKLAEAMKLAAEGLNVSWEGLRRRTEDSPVAADLIISADDIKIKYNVYLRKDILLQFRSTDRSRVELAALLLRLAGVSAEVRKEVGGRDVWCVVATTDKLAAGREEFRKALAEIVRKAVKKGWVDAGKAEGWLEKLEKGLTLREGWPKYEVGLAKGALMVRFTSTNSGNIEREAQRLKWMGLKEGKHFSVKMPRGGKAGYVYIREEGLAYAARLSVNGSKTQRELAAEFVRHILRRAEEAGEEVRKKAEEIVKEGMSRGSQKLEDFEKKVEVNGKTYVVKVRGGEAVEERQGGKPLLRIRITAEVGRVEGEHVVRVVREYIITFGRDRKNAVMGRTSPRSDAPDGKEADTERLAAVIEALTGVKPKVYRRSDGDIEIICGREHLHGFMRYKELADAIEKWLEETRR